MFWWHGRSKTYSEESIWQYESWTITELFQIVRKYTRQVNRTSWRVFCSRGKNFFNVLKRFFRTNVLFWVIVYSAFVKFGVNSIPHKRISFIMKSTYSNRFLSLFQCFSIIYLFYSVWTITKLLYFHIYLQVIQSSNYFIFRLSLLTNEMTAY